MRLTLRALSALLGYPSAELAAHVDELRRALHAEGALPALSLARLEPLLASFEREELLALQARYCDLFDRSRALSLHLFEHVHGDGRERGQAMIDLGQHYVDHGFEMTAAELPDFLPMFLEFLSCLEPEEAQDWLAQPAHVLAALEQRLTERESAYAGVFSALRVLGGAQPDPETLAELEQRHRAIESRSIDEEWEDAPVDFSQPAAQQEGRGAFARLRAAARRAVGP